MVHIGLVTCSTRRVRRKSLTYGDFDAEIHCVVSKACDEVRISQPNGFTMRGKNDSRTTVAVFGTALLIKLIDL